MSERTSDPCPASDEPAGTATTRGSRWTAMRLPCGRDLSRFRNKATRIGLDGGNHLSAAVGQLSATCFTFAEKRKPGQYLL
jgi:hypothetical protein